MKPTAGFCFTTRRNENEQPFDLCCFNADIKVLMRRLLKAIKPGRLENQNRAWDLGEIFSSLGPGNRKN